jgi:hypothetical protein
MWEKLSKLPSTRTSYYPIKTTVWLGKEEVEEYLCNEPFENEKSCISFCISNKINRYTIEQEKKEKVLFDDNLNWIWETVYLTIKNTEGGEVI